MMEATSTSPIHRESKNLDSLSVSVDPLHLPQEDSGGGSGTVEVVQVVHLPRQHQSQSSCSSSSSTSTAASATSSTASGMGGRGGADGNGRINPLDPLPSNLRSIEGIDKLRRAIGKELVSENSNEQCSNLPHLLSIVKTILEFTSSGSGDSPSSLTPSAVLKPFNYIPKLVNNNNNSHTSCSNRGKRTMMNPLNYMNEIEQELYCRPGTKKKKGSVRFIVDVVSAGGEEWFKVSARNPKSLLMLAKGGGGYGQKSILDHAKEYIKCAEQNPCLYKPPKISFIFTCGIGSSLAERLEVMGIHVKGERILDEELPKHPRLKPYQGLLYESDSNSEEDAAAGLALVGSLGAGDNNGSTNTNSKTGVPTNRNSSGYDECACGSSELEEETSESDNTKYQNNHHHHRTRTVSTGTDSPSGLSSPMAAMSLTVVPVVPLIRNPRMEGIVKLNLDVTALLAYVSNLTNGHTYVKFRKKILADQCDCEKLRPQKPVLDSLFRGRELYCCQTAFNEFKTILETVGGNSEKIRSIDFLRRIKVVPDKMSERSRTLQVIGNVKLRSAMIFGTGDYIQAVTVSANSGFVRSAKSQGLDFAVFLHESRALTEQKEIYAKTFLLGMQ